MEITKDISAAILLILALPIIIICILCIVGYRTARAIVDFLGEWTREEIDIDIHRN